MNNGIVLLRTLLLSTSGRNIRRHSTDKKKRRRIIGSAVGEAFMVVAYFVFESFLYAFTATGGFTAAAFNAGITSSAAGIPANIIQGVFGVVIAAVLYPILRPLINKQFE